MDLWFALSDNGLRMQLGAAFPIDLAGRLVHALMLMPFMIMDLRVPTNGTVVATDASVHGQGVCRTVGFTATGELDAKSREAQHTQLWDNCIGLVVMLRSFTSWRGAFDELDIQPATFALVGRGPTSNTKNHAAGSVVIAPVDFARKAVKTKLQHLKTWPNLVCPFAQCDLSGPMLVWLSWYVIVSDDQAGKPESFPSFTVVSISGAHHRQFRPGWTFAGGAGAKLPNFPLDSLPASTGLTGDATPDVQGSELRPFGFIGLHKVFTQQLFAPLVTTQRERNEAEAAGARSADVVVERLGRAISALQHHRGHRWKWTTVISNRWNHAIHDNSLQLQTHLASLRSRTRMQHAVRSLHDLDSQVAWGILTKNRSTSLRFCRVVTKCIVPCLTVSYITLLEYSCTAEHPADRASRAHEDVGDQSAGQYQHEHLERLRSGNKN